jgi:hypothetical protein
MLHFHRARLQHLAGIALLAVLACGPASPAQEPEKADVGQPAVPPPIPPPGVEQEDAESPARVAQMESRLSAEIDRIDRTCRLTGAQKKKLDLAGRADIKRRVDDIGDGRRRLRAAQNDKKQEQVEAIEQELNLLQGRFYKGMFRDDTMFAKTLARVLDDDQVKAYRAERLARRRFRHRAGVELVVQFIDAAVGCTAEQRDRLAKLLLDRTQLPMRSESDVVVLLAQAARLPESQVKPIFDDSQWPGVSRLLKKLNAGLKGQLDGTILEPDDLPYPIATREAASTTGKN